MPNRMRYLILFPLQSMAFGCKTYAQLQEDLDEYINMAHSYGDFIILAL